MKDGRKTEHGETCGVELDDEVRGQEMCVHLLGFPA